MGAPVHDNVEFSPEDAGRSGGFLCRVLEAVIDAGAKTVNIPVPSAIPMPSSLGCLSARCRRIPNSIKRSFPFTATMISAGCGNSLSAVMNGARQVECTINGLGERAGNAALKKLSWRCGLGRIISRVIHGSIPPILFRQ